MTGWYQRQRAADSARREFVEPASYQEANERLSAIDKRYAGHPFPPSAKTEWTLLIEWIERRRPIRERMM